MPDLTAIDYINVGKDGTFAHSGSSSTTPQQVEEIFEHLKQNDTEKLVIYFHGGLVSEKTGMEAATTMVTHFTKTSDKRHTVSFVWETGPKEIIMQNWQHILDKTGSSFFQDAMKFVIKIAAKKLGIKDGKGGDGGDYISDGTIEAEKYKQFPFEELDKEMDGKGGPEAFSEGPYAEMEFLADLEKESQLLISNDASEAFKHTTTDDDPALTKELEPTDDGTAKSGGWFTIAKLVAQVAFKVLKRYYHKTHHDFYPTVMEETFRKLYIGSIGTWGWSRIKEKAENMFAGNTGLSGVNLRAGSYFLELLQQHYKERNAAGKKMEIHLIGHSAGSIVICVMLKEVMERYKDLRFENVFFLAPACRTDLFIKNCLPAKDAGHFKKFKLFTMKTENEKKDHCIPYVYTHSLLYMVSGLFETDAEGNGETDAKILGLNEQFKAEGRYANFEELKTVNRFLYSNYMVLSDDNLNEDLSLRSTALKHGDFDNDITTLTSMLNSI
ncbi:alpha/beta hydrolase [Flavitalea sp.]|nr:alpha/beta hydrolase [Flavitalea sp.]